jgi:hypothetical protein
MRTASRYILRIVLLAMLSGTSAWGQSDAARITAREIAKAGLAAFDNGQYEEAFAKLAQAYEIVHVPTLRLYMARAAARLGKLIEASELYLQATRLQVTEGDIAGQHQAQIEAADERVALLPRIPKLVVVVTGVPVGAVEVTLDGQRVPPALFQPGQLANPGQHEVVARHGNEQTVQHLVLAEKELHTCTFAFRPGPAAAGAATTPTGPSTGRTLGWVGIGVGGAGLLFGGIAGLVAVSKRSSLNAGGCVNNHCYSDQRGDVDSYQTLRILSTVGFTVGVIGGAGGMALLTTQRSQQAQARTVAPVIGLGLTGLAGRF